LTGYSHNGILGPDILITVRERSTPDRIASQLRVDKVQAAVKAREDPDFLIIARTNAIRQVSFEESMVPVLSTQHSVLVFGEDRYAACGI
jgi:hypothetical protein